ncbi:glycosyltransferase [Arthrobacter sp. AB6]|uniref:glycosyltransferase n=1 Tax=Arthrobacter sp. AB6 TaxID=2962570 RepID=UPI002880E0B8|nr:glycosyltransferase [Arthrobacter sp. AB6]MDT0193762.1 glycosyltransferase [Arthrobacter sp. AB6]
MENSIDYAANRIECSVVVPTHRGAHRLPVLLEALAAQDYDKPWELVIVIDGNLDATAELLDSYRDRLPVVPLAHEEAKGVVAAMNDGIRTARGRIVIRCDDDLSPGPSFLRLHMRHHEDGRPVGVIGPTRDVFPDSPYAKAYGVPANERALAIAYRRDGSSRWVGWAANNSIPREALLSVGGFDPRFVYGQDSELGYRIASQGISIIVDPDLETLHRGPSTSVGSRAGRAFVSGASRRLFDSIHPGAHPPLPRPRGVKGRIWNAGVGTLTFLLRTREAYALAGKAVDRFLAVLPLPVASRIISLLVEAAGRSGRKHGNGDLASYKDQKLVELSRELSGNKR